jgi:hypothetical protein
MVARFIVPALLLPALMAAAPFDAPAVAATTLSFDSVGDTGGFGFRGLRGIDGTDDVGATLTLTLLSRTANLFSFGYSVSNDTGGNFDRATIVSFGFSLEQDLLTAITTGEFDRAGRGTVPGFGTTDFCAMAGGPWGSCTSNTNAGIRIDEAPGTGTLMLWLRAPSATIDLSDSFVRWSSVRSKPDDIAASSAISDGFTLLEPLPEPATWATMIMGFGLVGIALRRRAAEAPKELNDPTS